jgi:hypothetical protein
MWLSTSKHFITPFLVKIFNKLYKDGVYPLSWTKGFIVPIYKRGHKTDPFNYRDLFTLINTMATIFSHLHWNKLNKWCEDQHVFNDLQFWFRNKRSTSDCVFILRSIIKKLISNKLSKLKSAVTYVYNRVTKTWILYKD